MHYFKRTLRHLFHPLITHAKKAHLTASAGESKDISDLNAPSPSSASSWGGLRSPPASCLPGERGKVRGRRRRDGAPGSGGGCWRGGGRGGGRWWPAPVLAAAGGWQRPPAAPLEVVLEAWGGPKLGWGQWGLGEVLVTVGSSSCRSLTWGCGGDSGAGTPLCAPWLSGWCWGLILAAPRDLGGDLGSSRGAAGAAGEGSAPAGCAGGAFPQPQLHFQELSPNPRPRSAWGRCSALVFCPRGLQGSRGRARGGAGKKPSTEAEPAGSGTK